MPATKTPAKPKATAATTHEEMRRLDHISETLDVLQKDIGSIGSSLSAGACDLRSDVSKLLRDARRDVVKLRKALEHDLTRLQTDLASGGKPSNGRKVS